MILLVGLGNPGPTHRKNRHNVGYMAVDAIAEGYGFGPARAKFKGRLAEGKIGRNKVLILKPETFMNLSGESVQDAMRFYKIPLGNVIVFYDEIDLAPGKVRVRNGGGTAGHNGLRSLVAHIGEGFRRVRIGIGHPGHKDLVHGYVLSDFAKADGAWLDDLLGALVKALPWLIRGDDARFQNDVAMLTQAPKPQESKS